MFSHRMIGILALLGVLSVMAQSGSVKITVRADGCKAAAGCSVAVSVTDRNATPADSITSIEAELLLQSDIEGYIEDPGYYFRNHGSVEADQALDLLMMTQGWRRYDVPMSLHGIYSEPDKPLEVGQAITGKARTLVLGWPAADATIQLIAPGTRFANLYPTDSAGTFSADGFDLPDGTVFMLRPVNKKGKSNLRLSVDSITYPDCQALWTPFADTKSGTDDGQAIPLSEILRINGNSDLREVLLQEVVFVAEKPRSREYEDIFDLIAAKSYGIDFIEQEHVTHLDELVRRIAGVRERNGNLYYRGSTACMAIFIDGTMIEPLVSNATTALGMSPLPSFRTRATGTGSPTGGTVAATPNSSGYGNLGAGADGVTPWIQAQEMVPLHAVRRVDFLQPGMSLMFGADAANGAINIMTRRGLEKSDNTSFADFSVVRPLGYQRPRQFYVPKYDRSAYTADDDYRATLLWIADLKLDSDGMASIEIPVDSSRLRDLRIDLQGITPSGQILNAR